MLELVDDPEATDLMVPGADVDVEPDLTLLALLEECKEEYGRQEELLEEARVREACVLGTQWTPANPLYEQILAEAALVTLDQENVLLSLSLTYDARLNQGRIEPRAYPTHPERSDEAASDATQMLLDHFKQKNAEDQLCHRGALRAQMHGDCLFLPSWKEDDGPHVVRRQAVDPATGEPMYGPDDRPVMEEVEEYGAVIEEVIDAPNYWTSGEELYEDAQYVVIRRVIDKFLARRILLNAGFADPRPSTTQQTGSLAGSTREGVETFEIYYKPGARFELGVYGLVVGGMAARCTPYPLDHDELPGAVFKIVDAPGSSRGKTHVSDAIFHQRRLNATLRSILKLVVAAGDFYTIGHSTIVSAMRGGHRRIDCDLSEPDKRVMQLNGAKVPRELFEAYELSLAGIHRTFGVSEQSASGGDPGDTSSGRQLDLMNRNDAQKIVAARRNLEQARLRVARQKVCLFRQYADAAYLISVLGPVAGAAHRFIRSADVMGTDVTLEIGSGALYTREGQKRAAEEDAAAGKITPQEGAERSRTGLASTIAEGEMRRRVEAQGIAALQGKPQEPLPDVDGRLASEVLLTILGGAIDATPEGRAGLLALIELYHREAAERAKAAKQAGGGGKPPAKGGGGKPQQGGGLKPTETAGRARDAVDSLV